MEEGGGKKKRKEGRKGRKEGKSGHRSNRSKLTSRGQGHRGPDFREILSTP